MKNYAVLVFVAGQLQLVCENRYDELGAFVFSVIEGSQLAADKKLIPAFHAGIFQQSGSCQNVQNVLISGKTRNFKRKAVKILPAARM